LTKQWTFTASLALLAVGVLTMSLIPNVWGATLGSLLIGAGSGISASYLTTLVIQRAPDGARERAVGLIAPAHYVGQFSNPFIMQSLAVSVGIQSAFMIVGLVLCVAAAAAAFTQARSQQPRRV
jgi:MFS family permease